MRREAVLVAGAVIILCFVTKLCCADPLAMRKYQHRSHERYALWVYDIRVYGFNRNDRGLVLFQVLADRVEILLHGLRVAVFYDDTELFKTFADAFELVGGVGVEEDFAQQVVVLAHQSVGYG